WPFRRDMVCRRRVGPCLGIGAPDALVSVGRHAFPFHPIECADWRCPADVGEREALRREVSLVGGQERGQVATRRMANHENLIWISAELSDVSMTPGARRRNILDVGGMRHSRRQPIIDDDSDDAARGEPLPDKRLLALVALGEGAAVDRYD